MKVIYEGSGNKDITSYRPITTTSVLYRLAMEGIKRTIEEWAENSLGELHNGFRREWRLDDNVFIIAQCIEVAQMRKKNVMGTFLDIKGSYDNVSQEKLWVQLRQYDFDAHSIRFLQQAYTNNKVVITREAKMTKPAEIKGLGQGCPPSPLLSIVYLSRMKKKLQV